MRGRKKRKLQEFIMSNKPIIRDTFDFDIGHLIKSPCNECDQKDKFPKCFNGCEVLDSIREVLAKGVSCTYSSYGS